MASTDLRIPDTPAMQGMRLIRWLAVDGAAVRAGDELFEIESKKANVSVESPASGRLECIALPGRPVLRGHLIGRIHNP